MVERQVLVVEDDVSLREAIIDTLEMADCQCLEAANGEEALLILKKESVALVISDVQMPGIDGLQLLRSMNNQQYDIPVIMMTAFAKVDDAVVAMREGAVDYLTKPFALDELDARLRAVKRRHVVKPAVTQTIGPLAYDPTNRTVWIGADQVQLRSQELKLFESLIQSTGWSASKEFLFDRLYGLDQDASANAIEVHISRLRRKLADYGLEI